MREASVNDRWLGAVCYLSFLVILPIMQKPKTEFLARHCRQGFALLFAEIVAFFVLYIIERTVGRIPILGLFVSILLHLAVFLVFLLVSAVGFVKALSGESWSLPALDELSDRVPIH